MKFIEVNERAMRDVLTAILGADGFEFANKMYTMMNDAERQGHYDGYGNGVTDTLKAGAADEQRMYQEGYQAGLDDGDDRDNEAVFKAGWDAGFAAGSDGRQLASTYEPSSLDENSKQGHGF